MVLFSSTSRNGFLEVLAFLSSPGTNTFRGNKYSVANYFLEQINVPGKFNYVKTESGVSVLTKFYFRSTV